MLPIWPFFVAASALLYFYCFFKLRSPFACGASELNDCSAYWPNHMWLQAFTNLAIHGTPGLIALVIARKFTAFLSIWLLLFLCWTFVVYRGPLGVDGQNGCLACDFGMFAMAMVSWSSLLAAVVIAVAVRTMSGNSSRSASVRH